MGRRYECDPFRIINAEDISAALETLSFATIVCNLMTTDCECGKYSTHIDLHSIKRLCLSCFTAPPQLTKKVSHSIKKSPSSIHKLESMSRSLSARSNSFGVVPLDETPTPVQKSKNESRVPFTNFQHSNAPQIIVDLTYRETISDKELIEFPLITNSLVDALYCIKPGWTIQIRRNWYKLSQTL